MGNLTIKQAKTQAEYYLKLKVKCKCGHSVIMPKWVDKQICDWCGNYVFKDKKTEDLYRIKEKINKC